MRALLTLVFCVAAGIASAEGSAISVRDAWVPLAPPTVRAHAAYFELENTGNLERSLVEVRAEGYAMAHLHRSTEADGVGMMHGMDQITLAAGQVVPFAPGGLHVMLMMPMEPVETGDTVSLMLVFADGEEVPVQATVRALHEGS